MSKPFWMHERIDELRAWAKSRIAYCERVAPMAPPIAQAQREQEMQTLTAVLSILDGTDSK